MIMIEEITASLSHTDLVPSNFEASLSRERKKRKWDEHGEPIDSAGTVVNPLVSVSVSLGTKDKLPIAREVVINDAEPSVRFQLTRRHTQEEIQKCTGAVVITRGKYRLPNTISEGEKPLYLHILAGSHLKDTVARILAVDKAAAIVEDILKLGLLSPFLSQLHVQEFNASVFLGFDADQSLNIASRIRGPNRMFWWVLLYCVQDLYLKHIVNETGATVTLKGRGSVCDEYPDSDTQEPLHLFISSSNPKSLDKAKALAVNLLRTVASEFGFFFGGYPNEHPYGGSNYSGYGGIYPQAHLPQVGVTKSSSSAKSDKGLQKRKFQEVPPNANHQKNGFFKIPPPPPKFSESKSCKNVDVPDTLAKLMEYGDEDDDS